MIPSVFPCYAAADRDTAARIAEFLEAGARVRVFLDDGEMRLGEDLVSKAREACSADVALVLFSRHSLPARWSRAQWEDALLNEPAENGVRMAFVTCDDCAPPQVLKPRFDASLTGMRGLKRWLRTGVARWPAVDQEMESLAAAIADRAGVAAARDACQAVAFAEVCRDDFDEVFALECCGRSLAAVAGDLAAQLGLRLDSYLKSNLARLREFCAERRFLVLLANAAPGQIKALTFGGRCSTLLARGPGVPMPDGPLVRAQAALAEPGAGCDWTVLCEVARLGRRLLHEQQRLAECFELMQQWQDEAERRDDGAILDEAVREMVWILESWGRVGEAQELEFRRIRKFGEQLALEF